MTYVYVDFLLKLLDWGQGPEDVVAAQTHLAKSGNVS